MVLGKMNDEMKATVVRLINEPAVESLFVVPGNSTPSIKGQMAKHLLGAVNPIGGAVGGLIGGVVGAGAGALKDAVGKKKEAPPPQPAMTPHMLIVVGPTKFALIEWKQGFFKNSLGQLLAQYPKSDVVGFEPGAKTRSVAVKGLTVALADGTRYEFEHHWGLKKQREKVRELLGL